MKTIKQLAEDLGVSKDKIKYQVRKLPSEKMGKIGKNTQYITHLENQIKQQTNQIETLHTLLDQQQRLTSQANQKIELLESKINIEVKELKSITEEKGKYHSKKYYTGTVPQYWGTDSFATQVASLWSLDGFWSADFH